MIIMLYVGVVNFVGLLWQYIEVKFPDALNFYYAAASGAIRGHISALLIVWPVMIFMTWLIGKDLHKNPIKKDSRIRKWLLYLTLFLAAITIIIDLITLTNFFLSGELTVRFIFRVLVVLIVAVSVFAYYLWELRRDPVKKTHLTRIAAVVSAIVVFAAIVGGFFIIGSPSKQRAIRFDDERVQDLQMIQSSLINYWTQKSKIPAQLSELTDSVSGFRPPLDPSTKQPYEYTRTSDLTFELCATFTYPSETNSREKFESAPMPYGGSYMDNWSHGGGRICFERTIDPELYRPIENTKLQATDKK